MIKCNSCNQNFNLNETKGSAGITSTGRFIGSCPICNYQHLDDVDIIATHSDDEIDNMVEGLELAGDNFCQRLFDKLCERGWQLSNGTLQ